MGLITCEIKDILNLAIISAVFAYVLYRWSHRRQLLLCTKFKTNWWHVIRGFGYFFTSKGTIGKTYKDTQKYGSNVLCYVGPIPMLLTTDPEVLKDIFTAKQCVNKPDIYYGRLENSIGRGFITMSDPHWSNERKIVNAAFNNKNLMSFIPIFNEEVDRVLQDIDKDIDEKKDKPMVIYFREFTVRIATRTAIGRDVDKTEYTGKKFAQDMNEYLIYGSEMMLNQIYAIGILRYIARKTYFYTSAMMKHAMDTLIKESLHNFGIKRGVDPSYETRINTAIEYMAKGVEQNKMKAEYVVDDLIHLFLGAFETTSSSLYYILLMIGMYPEHQQRAYEEVCSIFPDDDDGDFEVTYEDINQMVFIDMLMNETMRVLPIIPHAAREVVGEDLTLSNGIVLPKGLCIVVDIYTLHHSKEIWGPDVDKFNPDNFLPSNIEAKHPYSFIPFTKGLRFCIGWRYAQLSIKTALAKLIKRYKFTTHCKLEDLVLENHVTSQLRWDPPLSIERRKKPKNI